MRSPSDETFIGLDLGTTVCKGVVTDRRLQVLSYAECSYPLITRSAEEIEQDAEQWLAVSGAVIRRLLSDSAVDPSSVRSLSISAQGISFVPVDSRGRPLRPALTWLDTRAREQAGRAAAELGEGALFARTGKRVSSVYVLPKLLWLKEREPEVFRDTTRILMALDFLIARMCGEAVTDHTMASGTVLYDIHRQEWAAWILEHFALDPALLPPLARSGSAAGTLLPEVAAELGLPGQAVVVVGGQDQKVAALGAGIDLKRTTISLGTAMAIIQQCVEPVVDPAMRVPCFTDLFPGRWVLEGSGIGTSALDWVRGTMLADRSFEELEAMTLTLDGQENHLYFYPFLAGTDTLHRGEAVRGFLYGLDFSVRPERIVKSVYEGIGYQIREHMQLLEELSRPVGELRLFGGGSKSDLWAQTIADITRREVVTLTSSEMGCLGAAILAAVGAGAFARPEEAYEYLAVRRRFGPRPGLESMYQDQYGEYLEIQRRMFQETTS
jgi:xylulokinase